MTMKTTFLPFSRPSIGADEIEEVVDSLKSGWITTGPKVQQFESDFAKFVGAKHAVAVNSATSGLHLAYLALGLKPGEEAITTPLTFISTVSMLCSLGVKPVLADIDPNTLNIDPGEIEKKITKKTRAIVPVHFAGLPCDLDRIKTIARKHRLKVIEDAAHAAGTEYKGGKIGALSDATVFSFHPIKNMTTGEGGMITTNDDKLAEKLALLRFHGMNKLAWKRYGKGGSPHYDINCLGYKYNMMDIQAALGIHQLRKLSAFNALRSKYAQIYRKELGSLSQIHLPQDPPYGIVHPWHLFIIVIKTETLKISRDEFIQALSDQNIGTGIHFKVVHQHPYYKELFTAKERNLPNANYVSERILSLPLYPSLNIGDVTRVCAVIKEIIKTNAR